MGSKLMILPPPPTTGLKPKPPSLKPSSLKRFPSMPPTGSRNFNISCGPPAPDLELTVEDRRRLIRLFFEGYCYQGKARPCALRNDHCPDGAAGRRSGFARR